MTVRPYDRTTVRLNHQKTNVLISLKMPFQEPLRERRQLPFRLDYLLCRGRIANWIRIRWCTKKALERTVRCYHRDATCNCEFNVSTWAWHSQNTCRSMTEVIKTLLALSTLLFCHFLYSSLLSSSSLLPPMACLKCLLINLHSQLSLACISSLEQIPNFLAVQIFLNFRISTSLMRPELMLADVATFNPQNNAVKACRIIHLDCECGFNSCNESKTTNTAHSMLSVPVCGNQED